MYKKYTELNSHFFWSVPPTILNPSHPLDMSSDNIFVFTSPPDETQELVSKTDKPTALIYSY